MRGGLKGAAGSSALLVALLASGCMVVTNGHPRGTQSHTGVTSQPGGPLINSMSASAASVAPNGAPLMLTVAASSPTGNAPLTYQWSTTGGALSATRGSAVQWIPPANPGKYQVGVLVADTKGLATVGTFNLQVVGASTSASPTPSPTSSPVASPSASPT